MRTSTQFWTALGLIGIMSGCLLLGTVAGSAVSHYPTDLVAVSGSLG